MINPYLNRSTIRNEGDFFGRKEEIHNIYMRITHEIPQSCSVVGLRRIGKSSLLYHLSKKRGGFSKYLPPERDNLFCVFYDLQSEKGITIPRFFGKLRQKTLKAIENQIADLNLAAENGDEEEAFERLVEYISEQGYGLVFLFDEFESITQNQNFDEDFFSQLRYVANNYNVAYVTSSQEELSKLCHTDMIAQSPFFNIFTKMHLHLLGEDEAISLIREPAQNQGIQFTDQEIELVFELAGYHPFFIQVSCSHLFELKGEKEIKVLSKANFDQIRQQFMVEAVDHFNYYLKHLNEKEKSVLQATAGSVDFDPVAAGVVSEIETLKRGGLIIQHRSQVQPFSASFRDFLQTLPPVSSTDLQQEFSTAQNIENLVNVPDEGDYDGLVWHQIISLEKRFRLLLKQMLEAEWKESWEQQIQKRYSEWYAEWLNKRQQDSQAFRSYERPTTNIFDFSYLDQLSRIMEDEWAIFRTVFEFLPGQGKQNKQLLHQKLEEIVKVRNPLAHGRTVPDTELRRAHVSCDDFNKQLNKWERKGPSQSNESNE